VTRRPFSLAWIALWALAFALAAFLLPTLLFALIQIVWSK